MTSYLKKILSPVKILFLVLVLHSVLFILLPSVKADRLQSDSYIIVFGNFNMTSGEKNSASYNLTDTVGQTGDGPFGEYGNSDYFIGSGFQYIYQIDTFSFSVSDVVADLGTLTPGVHNTDSHTLTISTRGGGGYTVYAYTLHALRHQNGTDSIPHTTCNSGTCSYTTAGIWNDQDIPGFGYNMSGNDVPAAFVDSTYYKAFANSESAQTMQSVMSSANIADQRQSTITYKAGVSGTQAAGGYSTGVVFVAVPGY